MNAATAEEKDCSTRWEAEKKTGTVSGREPHQDFMRGCLTARQIPRRGVRKPASAGDALRAASLPAGGRTVSDTRQGRRRTLRGSTLVALRHP